MFRTTSDLSEVKRKIRTFIKEKVEESETDGLVLEMRGDVSSAVNAQLCVEAVGARRVTGFIMPDLRLSIDEDIEDAKAVAQELCLETREIDIAPIHKTFMKKLEENRVAEESLRARIRMSVLYYNATLLNRLVSGSVDKSELLSGYFTKYGNDGADILPIGDLYRSEVLRLAEVLGVKRRIVAKRREGRRGDRTGQMMDMKSDLDSGTMDQIFRLRFDQGLDAKSIASALNLPSSKVEDITSPYRSSSTKRKRPEICALS